VQEVQELHITAILGPNYNLNQVSKTKREKEITKQKLPTLSKIRDNSHLKLVPPDLPDSPIEGN
jgi:hypothetical protein